MGCREMRKREGEWEDGMGDGRQRGREEDMEGRDGRKTYRRVHCPGDTCVLIDEGLEEVVDVCELEDALVGDLGEDDTTA